VLQSMPHARLLVSRAVLLEQWGQEVSFLTFEKNIK
jgi:hypothetical protein